MRASIPAVVVVLLLFFVGAAWPPGAAQFPPAQDPPVAIEVPTTTQTVSSEEPLIFTARVSRPPASGSPIDQMGSGAVSISFGGVPDEWTVAAEPSAFQLAPGASQDVAVTVAVPPGGDTRRAEITVTAAFTSPDVTNLILPDGEASGTVTVQRQEALTRDVLEAVGTAIWVVLGLALAAILVAVYLFIDSRRRLVRLSVQAAEVIVAPGSTVSIPVAVRNLGRSTDRVSVHADVTEQGWTAKVPAGDLEMASGEAEEVHVAVTAPKNASIGSREVVRVLAVPQSDPRRADTLTFAVLVEK